jgi:aspartate--ammonia ligase
MGIRVDKASLIHQLTLTNSMERTEMIFHNRLIQGELPLSVGGGIGQSRICMYYLRKAHIGEVQASIWPSQLQADCKRNNIFLL